MPYLKYKREGLTSLREAAQQTGISYGRFWRMAHFHNKIEAPATAVGLRKYYDQEQLQRVIMAIAALRQKGVI